MSAKNKKYKSRDLIIKTLKEKSCLKQDVYHLTLDVFAEFKKIAAEVAVDISEEIMKETDCIEVKFIDKGDFEFHLKVAGDILVFYMHTNVFQFDKEHAIWKTSYVKEDEMRSYCGMMTIYNFLADSFKYNRSDDIGYLIARMFVNKDKHYFIEGKRQLGFLYNDFVNNVLDEEQVRSVIHSAVIYSLSFDLLTPPYAHMQEISVQQMLQVTQATKFRTGKRLGFHFQADSDEIH